MRIILATDGTPGAKLAQSVLEKLPIPHRARVTVATVVRSPAPVEIGAAARTVAYAVSGNVEAWRRQRESRRILVDELAAGFNERGFVGDGLMLEGDAADALIKLVRDDSADLVVSGSGENSDLSAFFLGSVSRKLALSSEASILIGRSYPKMTALESIDRLERKGKLHVLVAYDGSVGSEIAIDTLKAVKPHIFDTVSVLAVDPVTDWRLQEGRLFTAPIIESDPKLTEQLVSEAAKKVRYCAEHVEWLTGFGRPSIEICRIAALRNVDLIVLAANQHGALERWLLGSCAYETATSAPCSVLILRKQLHFEEEPLE